MKETLTKDNAHKASTIICIAHPEYGSKRFNYNSQPLNDDKVVSSFGCGSSSRVLFESEYKFWAIETYK